MQDEIKQLADVLSKALSARSQAMSRCDVTWEKHTLRKYSQGATSTESSFIDEEVLVPKISIIYYDSDLP